MLAYFISFLVRLYVSKLLTLRSLLAHRELASLQLSKRPRINLKHKASSIGGNECSQFSLRFDTGVRGHYESSLSHI